MIHILFWLFVLSFYTLLFGNEDSDYKGAFQFVIMLLPVTIATTYFLNYSLVSKFILKKKYLLFTLYFIYTFIISITLELNVVLLTFVVIADFKVHNMVPASFNIIYLVAANYLVILFAVAAKLLNLWYKIEHENLQLEKRNMEIELKLKEAELKLLKAQIHPHFLFNTLNNLYGLVLAGSKNAPDIVLKISSLLDYMLYQSSKALVNLQDEIQYIKDYIELEKLRYSKLEVRFAEKGQFMGQTIAPMLLQPFVENAFKHGISKDSDKQWLEISIIYSNNVIEFSVKNPKVDDTSYEQSDVSEGIGLKNVQKRLDILYQGQHTLETIQDNDSFRVDLKLALNHIP